MKLLRAIRFDASDTFVFDRAAEPDEWAVSGASLFADVAPDMLAGKLRQAFANGFLGATSLGHATFAVVASAPDDLAGEVAASLAGRLVEDLGAPDQAAAMAVAEAEVTYAAELCGDLAVGSVLAVSRALEADGRIAETFRVVRRGDGVDHQTSLWGKADDA